VTGVEEWRVGAGDLLAARYRLYELSGAGDMGVVWRARDELLGRTVAVKRLVGPGQRGARADRLREALLREGRLAAMVGHPRLLRVLDVVAGDSEEPWLVLQHVAGHTWSALLQREGRSAPRAAAHVAAQVADALAALHHVGIVHGDVTPDNILVTPDGEAKLTDFGAARLLVESAASGHRMTGVRDRRAPEVRAGGPSGVAADVYALGAAVFEAVEGTAVGPEPVPLHHAGPLTAALRRLLATHPGARPTADEASLLLAGIAEGQ
jgi:serine/threonine protein kinase